MQLIGCLASKCHFSVVLVWGSWGIASFGIGVICRIGGKKLWAISGLAGEQAFSLKEKALFL
jgi:hypothetical protein